LPVSAAFALRDVMAACSKTWSSPIRASHGGERGDEDVDQEFKREMSVGRRSNLRQSLVPQQSARGSAIGAPHKSVVLPVKLFCFRDS
jgi:hypothetical protein